MNLEQAQNLYEIGYVITCDGDRRYKLPVFCHWCNSLWNEHLQCWERCAKPTYPTTGACCDECKALLEQSA